MLPRPTPHSSKPAPVEWPAAWKAHVEKSLGPAAGAREMEEARRMANALVHAQSKPLPEIKAYAAKRR